MARCFSNTLHRLSGRIGDVIYYHVGNKLYARRSPGQMRDCRSELQLYHRERMKRTATFYGVIRQTWLFMIWQLSGSVKSRSGYSLFLQSNMRAFDRDELLFDRVHFSSGNLFLPNDLRACREGNDLCLTWKNESVMRGERLRDELWCVVMTEDLSFRIVTPEEAGSVRGDENAKIALAEEERGMEIHLYCFFGAVDRDNFSENIHLGL